MLPVRYFAPVPKGDYDRSVPVSSKEKKMKEGTRVSWRRTKKQLIGTLIPMWLSTSHSVVCSIYVWKKGAPCCLATPHCASKLGEIPDVTHPQYQFVSVSLSSRLSCLHPKLSPLDSSYGIFFWVNISIFQILKIKVESSWTTVSWSAW